MPDSETTKRQKIREYRDSIRKTEIIIQFCGNSEPFTNLDKVPLEEWHKLTGILRSIIYSLMEDE